MREASNYGRKGLDTEKGIRACYVYLAFSPAIFFPRIAVGD